MLVMGGCGGEVLIMGGVGRMLFMGWLSVGFRVFTNSFSYFNPFTVNLNIFQQN